MIKGGWKQFAGKRVLLLQGPNGPFFARLARDLREAGADVCKVDFNGGDWLFSPRGSIAFRDRPENWPPFFERLLAERRIDIVILFGDCRRMHRTAGEIARRRFVKIGVFEEGYIRPDHITFEQYGVNGYSQLPRTPEFYRDLTIPPEKPPVPVGHTFWYQALWGFLYYAASMALWPWFRHYRHHKPLTPIEGLQWLRSFWRKGYFAMKEQGMLECLQTALSGKYFFVPLQVYNDGQIRMHSDFGSVRKFIARVMESFALYAPAKLHLVIKHHPMDRGHTDYSGFIRQQARLFGIQSRVMYIHDLHLPTILQHARGVVLVNSTVGLSAMHHGVPLKVCGTAIYDLEGLTYQGPLDDFWRQAPAAAPDRELYLRLRSYLIQNTQLNGSFYKQLAMDRPEPRNFRLASLLGTKKIFKVPDELQESGGRSRTKQVSAAITQR